MEVSLDGRAHWEPCELVTGERPHVWSLWRYTWLHPSAGRRTLLVRATDGTSAMQTAGCRGRFPGGTSGYDRMEVFSSSG
ncbi:hypothetical protein [Longimicrobium sp.]|uniref:hypothetical protein n=1 Tax=Longimicrobium sp. TaxID=2029185 RepID=UPI002ED822DA